jgi:hypothetical protein
MRCPADKVSLCALARDKIMARVEHGSPLILSLPLFP